MNPEISILSDLTHESWLSPSQPNLEYLEELVLEFDHFVESLLFESSPLAKLLRVSTFGLHLNPFVEYV